MKFDAATALIVVDVQKAIDDPRWAEKNNPEYQGRIHDLLTLWRTKDWPIYHVKHNSLDPLSPYHDGQPTNDFKPETAPMGSETIIEKKTNNAFLNTSLGSMLRISGVDKLVVCGVLTHHSIDATVRHAAGLGFQTFVMGEACSASSVTDPTGQKWEAAAVHAMALGVLQEDYAQVISMADVFAAL